MRNLWERLRPELKEEVINHYEKLPNLFNELVKELEKEYYYTSVKYWVFSDLRGLSLKAFGHVEHYFNNYFSPE